MIARAIFGDFVHKRLKPKSDLLQLRALGLKPFSIHLQRHALHYPTMVFDHELKLGSIEDARQRIAMEISDGVLTHPATVNRCNDEGHDGKQAEECKTVEFGRNSPGQLVEDRRQS